MPENIDRKKLNKVKPDIIKKPGGNLKPDVLAKPNLSTDLNIVLSKEHIDLIIKDLFERGLILPGGLAALASDHCCVDASVGSSVAGPYSSVGSSVSMPDINAKTIREKLTAEKVKVKVSLPEQLKIK